MMFAPGVSPQEKLQCLFWSEASESQQREHRTSERHHEGGWLPSSPSPTYRKKSFEHLVPTAQHVLSTLHLIPRPQASDRNYYDSHFTDSSDSSVIACHMSGTG